MNKSIDEFLAEVRGANISSESKNAEEIEQKNCHISFAVNNRRFISNNSSACVWFLVFQFLEENDLIRASGVCFSWWKMIFGFKYFSEQL